jgi:hypothetical protein
MGRRPTRRHGDHDLERLPGIDKHDPTDPLTRKGGLDGQQGIERN